MESSVYDWMKEGYTIVPNVLIDHFAQLGLTGDEFVLIIYLLKQINQSQSVEGINSIANQLSWNNSQLYATLNSLLDKDFLNIELVPDKDGKQTDHYTLRPLFDQMTKLFDKEIKQSASTEVANNSVGTADNSQASQKLVQEFETHFGRALSSAELDTLHQWLVKDAYSFDLILHALKEASIRQVFNFKYIDRILLNWQTQNIKSVEEAKHASQRYVQSDITTESPKSTQKIKIPILDWDQKK